MLIRPIDVALTGSNGQACVRALLRAAHAGATDRALASDSPYAAAAAAIAPWSQRDGAAPSPGVTLVTLADADDDAASVALDNACSLLRRLSQCGQVPADGHAWLNVLSPTDPAALALCRACGHWLWHVGAAQALAADLLKGGFDEAISRLDECDDANFKRATLQMQRIRDDLVAWLP